MSLRIFIGGVLISILGFIPVFGIVSAHETTEEHAEEHLVETLVAQINELLAIVADLQAQLLVLAADPNTPNVGFTKNFSIGDDDFEVLGLQKMLNRDPRTKISSSGPGSPGQETSYYGALTANAVARFQELFADEILKPNGLTRGSGYFGPSTRAKMNDIIRITAQATAENTPGFNEAIEDAKKDYGITTDTENTLDSSALTGESGSLGDINIQNGVLKLSDSSINYEFSKEFSVGHSSSYAGSPGESITIEGVKLTNSTRIHFGDSYVNGTALPDGSSLTFKVPNITKGPYELTFTDGFGKKALRIMDFTITNENATAPEIYSVSPAIGPNGTRITIYGKGFTKTNNQVEFGQNVVKGIPSNDGRTLSVVVNPNIELSEQNLQQPNAEWPVFIYVANANGRAFEPTIFVIKN